MSVYSEFIRDATNFEVSRVIRTKAGYANNGIPITTLDHLMNSNEHVRIHFPIDTFNEFYNMNIDFDPYDPNVYCFLEEFYNTSGAVGKYYTNVNVFIINLKNKNDSFFIETAAKIICKKIITGNDRYAILTNIKNICGKNMVRSYIEDVRNGRVNSIRYLPDPMKFIEQLDADKLKDKLIDCYKLILDSMEDSKSIKYELLVDNNMESITNAVLLPIVSDLICSKNNIFNIAMAKDVDLEKHRYNIECSVNFNPKQMILMDCIKELKLFTETYTHKNAFMYKTHHNQKAPALEPNHTLAIWELIKFVMSDFKPIYILLKILDGDMQKHTNPYVESEHNWDVFFGEDNKYIDNKASTFKTTTVPVVKKKFNPEPYNDFYEFEPKKLRLEDDSQTKYLSQYVGLTNKSQTDKLLENMGHDIGFELYQKLLPVIEQKLLFTK